MATNIQPTFDTFVFDLDGTLLDTMPDLVALTNATLRLCGWPERTYEEILSFVGNGVKALIYQAVPDGTTNDAAKEAMCCWRALYPTYGYRLTKAYEGIPETVCALKQRGARLGVLSNKFDDAVHEVIDAYLPNLFSVVHGECPDIPRKPNPSGLLRTIHELGSVPGRAAYVGDSAGDITVSQNAGIFSIGVSWGYHGSEHLHTAGADAIISRADALLGFFHDESSPFSTPRTSEKNSAPQ